MFETKNKYQDLIATLNRIGIALSAEKDYNNLLKLILSSAIEITHSDGGTLYLVHQQTELVFEIIANKSLNIKPSLAKESGINFQAIPLFIDNKPNLKNVAAYCYHENKTVNIDDAYHAKGFDFTGMKHSDELLHYHSKSFLTIPLRDHENKRIGVLQLINAIDDETGKVINFSPERVLVAESLASQAAITLTKQELVEAQKKLFEAFLELIAKAIDEKSHYTSNHCKRVPILTKMIAKAINNVTDGPLEKHHLSDEQFEELMIASWLHDCGKIVTPGYVLDKSKKLQTLCDRIEVINGRFEIIKRDIKIAYLEKLLANNPAANVELEKEYTNKMDLVNHSQEFLIKLNTGGEVLSEDEKEKIHSLGKVNTYREGNEVKTLLSDEDIMNLSISRGTLNESERHIIENHVKLTQSMLQSLPYPDYLKNVPTIAGSHHERIDGKGYPNGLKKDQLSIQARILSIADIFEALTSGDRPYKTAKTLKEVIGIMDDMKNSGHIDPDVYALFIKEKLYLEYAKQYLNPEQIDVL